MDGDTVGAYRSITSPSLFTKNLAKFHLIASPNILPPFAFFKNLYRGDALVPFTSIYHEKQNAVYQKTRRQCFYIKILNPKSSAFISKALNPMF